jgi:hypothetical protein
MAICPWSDFGSDRPRSPWPYHTPNGRISPDKLPENSFSLGADVYDSRAKKKPRESVPWASSSLNSGYFAAQHAQSHVSQPQSPVVQQSQPATHSHAHASHSPHALSLQHPADFAPVKVTVAAASSAASPAADFVAQQDLAVAADFAEQPAQSQSSQRQTPPPQQSHPATQLHAPSAQTWHEPPEQHPPAVFAVAVLPPDITNPSADTPVNARNVKSLDMIEPSR